MSGLLSAVLGEGGGGLTELQEPQEPQPGRRRIELGLEKVSLALAAGDCEALASAARGLAGLGVGRTPAGDDVLMGVLHALWASGHWARRSLSDAIVGAAAPLTTSFSAAWLRAAGRGRAAEPWHQLVAALGRRQDRRGLLAAAGRVRSMGHTSGAWALAGFVAALHALEQEGS